MNIHNIEHSIPMDISSLIGLQCLSKNLRKSEHGKCPKIDEIQDGRQLKCDNCHNYCNNDTTFKCNVSNHTRFYSYVSWMQLPSC